MHDRGEDAADGYVEDFVVHVGKPGGVLFHNADEILELERECRRQSIDLFITSESGRVLRPDTRVNVASLGLAHGRNVRVFLRAKRAPSDEVTALIREALREILS